jgi:hypothetical protein
MINLKSIIAIASITLSISCTNSQNFNSVDAAVFKATIIKTDDAQILDVRTPGEYANGNCPNIEKTFNDAFEIFIEQYKKK